MFTRSVLLVSLLSVALTATADDYKPAIADKSKEAELALQGFVLPDGMSGSLLASEPALANPVAFYAAHDGRVYVCETFRQEIGVEDNRSHMDWLHNDLRLESVEERLAMFRKYLGPDVAKYQTQHDRIRVLKDTDGNGTLDDDRVFAQGFNDILTGTGAGVIEVDGRVYYTCIPKLWMLEDTNGDGTADQTDALHHGYGVRVAFRGHDLHGLTQGPDGRLYFSIGDRGFNVITQEGTRLKRVDSGAVFRCDTDGANLEVFAYGLRNPQELAFDDQGNLFTVDNNSDSGDQARLVYVVQDGDSGWRMYYQYPDDRGPWNRERMWYPYRADDETTAVQPAFIVPPVANVSDGPSGLTFYPGLGLSDRYRNHFFLADFRGTAGNSGIRSFSVQPRGATFELTDSHQFIWSILGTDVDFAADGSLYVTDWVNGWVGEGKGRLYRFVDDENISAVTGANVPELLNGGVARSTTDGLLALLQHADRRVRQQAQFELVKKAHGDDTVRQQLISAAMPDGSDAVAARHALWACWQLGLASPKDSRRVAALTAAIFETDNVEQQTQAARILADLIARHGRHQVMDSKLRTELRTSLKRLSNSETRRLAGFATVALGRIGTSADTDVISQLFNENNDQDPIIRHQASMALTDLARRDSSVLSTILANSPTPSVQIAVVLAMRRLLSEQNGTILSAESWAQFLDADDVQVVDEAARAIHDNGLYGHFPALARVSARRKSQRLPVSNATMLRSLNALYTIGDAASAGQVAALAANSSLDDASRILATRMLLTWQTPPETDYVTGKWRPLPQREIPGIDAAVQPHLAGMLAGPKQVREQTIALAADLGLTGIVPSLQEILANPQSPDQERAAAFQALAALLPDIDELLRNGQHDASEAIRVAALELLVDRKPDAAVPALRQTLKSGSVRAQQAALKLLGQVANTNAVTTLNETFDELDSGQLPPAIWLDLLQAAKSSGDPQLKARVDNYRQQQASAATKTLAWNDCLEGGDVDRGRTVFFGRAAASCRRCHKVNGNGADVGPDLSAVAKEKDRLYLLEAIVDPNAKIAKGFETTIIVDSDGRIHSGIIKEETDAAVRLMTPQGAMISVAKDDIDERAKGQSGMPADLVKNLSREDVRDLVEYLSSLTAADTSAHGKSAE